MASFVRESPPRRLETTLALDGAAGTQDTDAPMRRNGEESHRLHGAASAAATQACYGWRTRGASNWVVTVWVGSLGFVFGQRGDCRAPARGFA